MSVQDEIRQGQKVLDMLLEGAPIGPSSTAWEAAYTAAEARQDGLLLSLVPDNAESEREVEFVYWVYGQECSDTCPNLRDAIIRWNAGECAGRLSGVGVYASDGTALVVGHATRYAYNRKYGLDD